jgi:hypothetical protein
MGGAHWGPSLSTSRLVPTAFAYFQWIHWWFWICWQPNTELYIDHRWPWTFDKVCPGYLVFEIALFARMNSHLLLSFFSFSCISHHRLLSYILFQSSQPINWPWNLWCMENLVCFRILSSVILWSFLENSFSLAWVASSALKILRRLIDSCRIWHFTHTFVFVLVVEQHSVNALAIPSWAVSPNHRGVLVGSSATAKSGLSRNRADFTTAVTW